MRCIFAVFLLFTLSCCGSNSTVTEFPPSVEAMNVVAEQLGWTLDADGTESWAENQIIYTLETNEQTQTSVSCALIDRKCVLTVNCIIADLPDKPEFSWETWKDVLSFSEALYGGFDEGELYQIFPSSVYPNQSFQELPT